MASKSAGFLRTAGAYSTPERLRKNPSTYPLAQASLSKKLGTASGTPGVVAGNDLEWRRRRSKGIVLALMQEQGVRRRVP